MGELTKAICEEIINAHSIILTEEKVQKEIEKYWLEIVELIANGIVRGF